MNFSENLATNLRVLRIKNGLSQKEVAAKLNTIPRNYQVYECGRCKTPLDIIVNASDYYSISIDDLLRNKLELIIK